ncbi:MAG: hypothetical protein ABIH35_04730 [Patescibacteria group bacterium]
MSPEKSVEDQKFRERIKREDFMKRLSSTKTIIAFLQNLDTEKLAKLSEFLPEWEKRIEDKFMCIANREVEQKSPKNVFTTLLKLRDELRQLQGQSGVVTQVIGIMQAEIESKIKEKFQKGLFEGQGFGEGDLRSMQELDFGDVIPDAQEKIADRLKFPLETDPRVKRYLIWFASTSLDSIPLELQEAFKTAAQNRFEEVLAGALKDGSLKRLVRFIKPCTEKLEAAIPGCGERVDKAVEELFRKKLDAADPDIFDKDLLGQIEPMIPDAAKQVQNRIKAWFKEEIASDDLVVLSSLHSRWKTLAEIIPGATERIKRRIKEVTESTKKAVRRDIDKLF